MCNIKVSIITPSYNQGQFIEETIKSVLSQTYKNIQYILVDGGSTDHTMEIVEKYRDKIDIIINEKDKGQSDAINKGFKLAIGELVGWINSDDILYPDCVAAIVNLYRQNGDGAIYYCSNLDVIDASSHVTRTIHKNIPDRNHLLNVNYDVVQQGSFYKRDIVERINFLDESIYYCMDLDLWLRLFQYGKIYALSSKSYGAFRMWEATKTTTGQDKFLNNIKSILLKYGANHYSRTILKVRWYLLKVKIKKIIKPLMK
jgi:glycosyltransferase involved in cell wall biosynthesis